MAVTILDIAKELGVEEIDGQINAGEIIKYGLPFFGGCECCQASVACYNMYPSKTGMIRCADCVGSAGYETVAEAIAELWEGQPIDQIRQEVS